MKIFTEKLSRKSYYMGPIEIKTSTIEGAGFGVFAKEKIKKRQLIERCPVILFDRWIFQLYEQSREHGHILSEYIFRWPGGRNVALAMGYGGMFNHSEEANAKWTYTVTEGKLVKDGISELGPFNCLNFYTRKDIEAGEELFIDYGIKSEFGLNDNINHDSIRRTIF